MPTYQYACRECGQQVEAVQKFSDDPLTVCDNCGGSLRKVFSPVGIVFKGSGFYRTDSRSGSTSTSSTAPAKASDDAGKSADKPAASADKPAEKKSSETVSASSSSEKVA
ncbi:MAG TPA: FmdB family zinc ribbon protein [Streptosporangiaceae bacterium]|nr:FmdB family zinc ribbon protein [Streptosporangiaceae bacterium]